MDKSYETFLIALQKKALCPMSNYRMNFCFLFKGSYYLEAPGTEIGTSFFSVHLGQSDWKYPTTLVFHTISYWLTGKTKMLCTNCTNILERKKGIIIWTKFNNSGHSDSRRQKKIARRPKIRWNTWRNHYYRNNGHMPPRRTEFSFKT